jgi:hypothetical protein
MYIFAVNLIVNFYFPRAFAFISSIAMLFTDSEYLLLIVDHFSYVVFFVYLFCMLLQN